MDIPGLDFPVLMLANPPQVPYLSGYGSDGEGVVNNVEVAYETGGEDDAGDRREAEPALRLRTMVRRGWLLANGHASTVASSLQDLGQQAATGVLLSSISPSSSIRDRRQAVDRAVAEGRDLGARIPGPPWVLRRLEVDDTSYALWLLGMDDDQFSLVADCGPIVLTGTGRNIDTWTFALYAVPASQVQDRLRIVDSDD